VEQMPRNIAFLRHHLRVHWNTVNQGEPRRSWCAVSYGTIVYGTIVAHVSTFQKWNIAVKATRDPSIE
jgi:hypothetical protein